MSRILAARLKRQKTLIEKLSQDKEHLEHLSRPAYHVQDTKINDKIAALQTETDEYNNRLGAENSTLADLQTRLSEMKLSYMSKKKELGSDYHKKSDVVKVEENLSKLETRLQQALNRHNEVSATLAPLRHAINTRRKERITFYKAYNKLERELETRKKMITSLTETCSHAYHVREDAHVKIMRIREKLDEEGVKWQLEMRELSRVIEHDTRMREYMKIKEKEPYKPTKTNQQILVEQVNSYEEAFQRIQKETGVQHPDEFVQKFISMEEQNYALYTVIGDLNNEIERNKEQMEEIKAELVKCEGRTGSNDHQRQRIRMDLESKCEMQANQYSDMYLSSMRTIHNLKNSIISLFQRVGCDVPTNVTLLGSSGVNETNIMQYIGIIEQRVREITQQYATKCTSEATKSALMQGPKSAPGAVVAPAYLPTSVEL